MASRSSQPEALQQRLIQFGIAVGQQLRRQRKDLIVDHFAKQVLCSATSPSASYAEAQGAESKRDFVHKLRICLKELRETDIWLRYLVALSGDGACWQKLRAKEMNSPRYSLRASKRQESGIRNQESESGIWNQKVTPSS